MAIKILKSDPSSQIKPPDKSMLLWETPFGMLVPPIYMILRNWVNRDGVHKFWINKPQTAAQVGGYHWSIKNCNKLI